LKLDDIETRQIGLLYSKVVLNNKPIKKITGHSLFTYVILLITTNNYYNGFSCNRLDKFKTSLLKAFSAAHVQSLPLDKLRESINKENFDAKYDEKEFDAAIQIMQEANQIYAAEDNVFLI
jgi:hypothetical protein